MLVQEKKKVNRKLLPCWFYKKNKLKFSSQLGEYDFFHMEINCLNCGYDCGVVVSNTEHRDMN